MTGSNEARTLVGTAMVSRPGDKLAESGEFKACYGTGEGRRKRHKLR